MAVACAMKILFTEERSSCGRAPNSGYFSYLLHFGAGSLKLPKTRWLWNVTQEISKPCYGQKFRQPNKDYEYHNNTPWKGTTNQVRLHPWCGRSHWGSHSEHCWPCDTGRDLTEQRWLNCRCCMLATYTRLMRPIGTSLMLHGSNLQVLWGLLHWVWGCMLTT